MRAIASRAGARGAPRSSTARTTRHSRGMRTENRSRISSRVRTGMWALRLGSRTSRPSWQSVWMAARTVGRATPNSAASSSSGRRTPGLDLAVEDARPQRDDDRLGGRDRSDGEPTHQAAMIVCRGARTAASARGASASPSSSGRHRAHAAPAGLGAPPLGGAHVEDRLRRAPPSSRGSDTTASNAPPNRYSAPGFSARETATTRFPDRTASATASRAPRERARQRDHAGQRLLAALLPAIPALAGQALEPPRQPVTIRQRLHAPA